MFWFNGYCSIGSSSINFNEKETQNLGVLSA